ncbi:receptor-like protein EIX1 [Neltuma alba]|uniref:receptor-like protein EIX1 n=1 Tax=Neltuma alba TaxID=207710 RepID=UPI0010A43EE7|nr:receptor-like protein EIX1 [Prosopis alba]
MGKLPVIELFLLSLCDLVISVSAGSSDGHLVTCLASDRDALVDFKTGIHDPNNVLSSWRGSNCCEWHGIECDNSTKAVVAVDLHNPYGFGYSSYKSYAFWSLSGKIRPSLMKLKSLRLLDLSFNEFDGISIPEFFGSLENLQYLNLSNAGFSGLIPAHLGNLSHLKVLDLDKSVDLSNELYADNFQWIIGLVSLEHLVMNQVNLSLVKDWAGALNQLPSIVELHLSGCYLSGYIPSVPSLNFSSLVVMDLSFNNFYSKIPDWLVNISSLQHIDMTESNLHGRIPLGLGEMPNLLSLDLSQNYDLTANCSQLFQKRWEKIQVINFRENMVYGKLPLSLGDMTSLTRLDLDSNAIEGGIPSSTGKLCNLNSFSLSRNNMTENLPEILEGTQTCPFKKPLHDLQYFVLGINKLSGKIPYWIGQLENIVSLDLSDNLFQGHIPTSFGSLRNLVILNLQKNKLDGTLPESLGQLSFLSELDISSNQLGGIISQIHFSKLINLTYLDLSSNLFIVNISSNWMPPFQVKALIMKSCILGPSFPSWLRSQKGINILDLSNASISDSIPNWFWMRMTYFSFLSLSQNQFSGQIPKSIWEKCDSLLTIDLSSNNFMGRIPSSLRNCSMLEKLDLSNNNLSGAIPNSLGQLQRLRLLHLSDNRLSGNLPPSFMNLSSLQTLDLGNNELFGGIPSWIGDGFGNLAILDLRSNAFFGEIPHELSKLSSLQVLDLGENDLSGKIPASFGDLKALTPRKRGLMEADVQPIDTSNIPSGGLIWSNHDGGKYQDRLVVNAKGQSLTYTTTLYLVTSIDLSGNNLSGRIPHELTKLSGLTYLNLSGNHLIGSIPESISNMIQLSSLDLSSNQLTGSIPQNLSSLSFLGYLNLSFNNLSGPIPYTGHTTTFEASSFVGNPDLYGCPLPVRCLRNGYGHVNGSNRAAGNDEGDDSDGLIDKWFYLSVGLGFATGLLVPFLILAMKRSWSDAYFDFVEAVIVKFFVLMRRTRINHGSKMKPRHRR